MKGEGRREVGPCSACDQPIIAEINSVSDTPLQLIPIGPASRGYFHKVVSFHCGSCGLVYLHPPGNPNAAIEILQELESAEENRKRLEIPPELKSQLDKAMKRIGT